MNRERAKEILEGVDRPAFQTIMGTLLFSRQDLSDVEEIERTDTNALIEEWKDLISMTHFRGSSSIGDLQRISLIETEFEDRLTPEQEQSLKDWYKDQEAIAIKHEEYDKEIT